MICDCNLTQDRFSRTTAPTIRALVARARVVFTAMGASTKSAWSTVATTTSRTGPSARTGVPPALLQRQTTTITTSLRAWPTTHLAAPLIRLCRPRGTAAAAPLTSPWVRLLHLLPPLRAPRAPLPRLRRAAAQALALLTGGSAVASAGMVPPLVFRLILASKLTRTTFNACRWMPFH